LHSLQEVAGLVRQAALVLGLDGRLLLSLHLCRSSGCGCGGSLWLLDGGWCGFGLSWFLGGDGLGDSSRLGDGWGSGLGDGRGSGRLDDGLCLFGRHDGDGGRSVVVGGRGRESGLKKTRARSVRGLKGGRRRRSWLAGS
jgi:hypothetical protein